MTTKHTVTVSYFSHGLACYVTDHTGIVIGITGTGQTTAEMADEILGELGATDSGLPDDVTDEQIRAAVLDELADDARFWPVNDHGDEINTDEDPAFLERETTDEEPCYWFRITVEEAVDSAQYEVRSEGKLEAVFESAVRANGYADELRGGGAKSVIVTTIPDHAAPGIELMLDTPNGPVVEYSDDDGIEAVEAAVGAAWSVDWATPAYRLTSGRWRAPLTPTEAK